MSGEVLCERCGSELKEGELRCPVCGRFTPPPEKQDDCGADDGGSQKARARVIRCTSCRAAVTYSPEAQNLRCAYCGEVAEVETPCNPIDETEKFYPFTVTREAAEEGLKTFWSRAKWYHHKDVAAKGTLTELRATWWPAWLCSADASFFWTADTTVGAGRSKWAPHAGRIDKKLDKFCVSASRGLTLRETSAIIDGYDLTSFESAPRGPEQATVECFELPRSQARQCILERINSYGLALVKTEVPELLEVQSRRVSTAGLLSFLRTENVSLPAYILAYRYKNRLYRVVINGQDASVSCGEYPVSVLKVAAVVLMVTVLIAVSIFVLLAALGFILAI